MSGLFAYDYQVVLNKRSKRLSVYDTGERSLRVKFKPVKFEPQDASTKSANLIGFCSGVTAIKPIRFELQDVGPKNANLIGFWGGVTAIKPIRFEPQDVGPKNANLIGFWGGVSG